VNWSSAEGLATAATPPLPVENMNGTKLQLGDVV